MSKQIKVKDAKCTGLSLQVPVEFKKDPEAKAADFVIEAYTGEVVDRWWGKLAIDVAGIKAKKKIPIFRDHERGNIVGYSSDTWKDGSFFVSGKFSQATPHAAEVKALAAEGFPWQASIGVMPLKVLAIDEKSTHEVNGKKIKGPAEVWLESEVFETSFVPLGADGKTSISVFSKFDEVEQPRAAGDDPPERKEKMSDKDTTPVVLSTEVLRADHPVIVAELLAEGAAAERERIKAVLEQCMPGHEALVNRLAFDGQTTGPQAAVAVLAAEKTIRSTALQDLAADGPAPVATPIAPLDGAAVLENKDLPIEERCKAAWDKDPAVRIEFYGNYDAYAAYRKAEEAGRCKILHK